jgi:hypothetical protein
MANLYRNLGFDPAATILDHNRRPMSLLDDREPVRELFFRRPAFDWPAIRTRVRTTSTLGCINDRQQFLLAAH